MAKIELIEDSIRKGLGRFSGSGALVVETGKFTGRAAQKRYLVDSPGLDDRIAWGGVNKKLDLGFADTFFQKLRDRLSGGQRYQLSAFVGSFPIQVHSSSPWHIVFCENMFREQQGPIWNQKFQQRCRDMKIEVWHEPDIGLSDLGISFGEEETLIVLDPAKMRVGIVGTAYAGEIKKAAFTLCNFKMPEFGIFPMHASANCLEDGSRSCVLFGLSGTGKTTLSASPQRYLIGDDEIIWSPTGLSNLEGGCYAKLIDLTVEKEPEIYRAVNRFGSIAENVVMDHQSREIDFFNKSKTENSRGSYCLDALEEVYDQSQEAEAPSSIVFLMADAFGAMPAVARLNSEQAQYYFMSGYTAKVAGTELGIKEPQAAFSACFGEPFMPRHVSDYAQLLAEYANRHQATIWLLNTGWTQGGYGLGQRFPLKVSRRILEAIQDGSLAGQPTQIHPTFGFEVPKHCPGVEDTYLEIPTGEAVEMLAAKFIQNSKKFSNGEAIEGGPQLKSYQAKASPEHQKDLSASIR